jgi:acyl dehydratase
VKCSAQLSRLLLGGVAGAGDGVAEEIIERAPGPAGQPGSVTHTSTGAAEAPAHAFDESLRSQAAEAEVAQTFDADQTFRYAEASGDPMPIHLDDQLAKSVGLPGIIIHGLCTMAFTSVAAIQHAWPEDPSRLERLAVRFAKPVQPGQTITTRIWAARPGAYAYETRSGDGATVIKDGLARIRS